MAFEPLVFDKVWTDAEDFPTIEHDESKVRADMQYLYDAIKDYINALITVLNSVADGASGADSIAATPLEGGVAATVQGILEELATTVAADAAARHTHSNKALLDTYDQTNAAIEDAVDKRHSHANLTLLNNIDSSKVAGWDNAATLLTGIESIVNSIGTGSQTAIPTAYAIANYVAQLGYGDMVKAVYDPSSTVATAGGITDYVVAILTEVLADYQTKLTFDDTPTAGSNNPVKSSGIKTALDGKANSSHDQAASTITAGTLAGRVQANASAEATLGNAQVRDITIGTSALTPGSSALATGSIYIVYEA